MSQQPQRVPDGSCQVRPSYKFSQAVRSQRSADAQQGIQALGQEPLLPSVLAQATPQEQKQVLGQRMPNEQMSHQPQRVPGGLSQVRPSYKFSQTVHNEPSANAQQGIQVPVCTLNIAQQ
ncbi:uncharacterized protein LOC116287374 [Actinia tenebrosa]|uniref:Uncharacterized protein LOC116287374 n=1 Tax=Actinia tenebrosa TaxID=6105 RepID=A0A6P8H0F7_ACTTE|nr:uncharacterized protein LOC116287374 [Actinia tenebrosa]